MLQFGHLDSCAGPKKQIEARLKWKTIILGADSRKQSPLLLNGDFGCYLQKLH